MQRTGFRGPSSQSNSFSRETVQGGPFLVDLSKLQRAGYSTFDQYLRRTLEHDSPPSSFALVVADWSLHLLTLNIARIDGEALSSFWKSPSCVVSCSKRTIPHPCLDDDEGTSTCDLFCSGSLSSHEPDTTLDMTSQSLFCISDHRGELTSCGILNILLHYQNRQGQQVLVSVELTIGCGPQHQGILVIQGHSGLTFSLK